MDIESQVPFPVKDDDLDNREIVQREAYLRHAVGLFSERYKRFRENGESRNVTLFKMDFKQVSGGIFPVSYDNSEIVIPSEVSTTVNYFDLYIKFLKVIDNDLFSDEKETGTIKNMKPEPETSALKSFIEQNPQARVKVTYLMFGLTSFEDVKDNIIATRFFNPETNEPISEIWTISRQKTA